MRDHILFIDTEGSGWPKKWDLPYSEKNNWPYSVQVAWIICTNDGMELKSENHYIGDNDFEIEEASYKVHGIDREFLSKYGESRQQVMMTLADDLAQYEPLLVGHFMELDLNMIRAEFYRTGIADFTATLPSFCTMKATTQYSYNPAVKYLRLSELYEVLFHRQQVGQHNALADARAAKECFFELAARGDINDENIEKDGSGNVVPKTGYAHTTLYSFIALFIGLFIIIWLLWKRG